MVFHAYLINQHGQIKAMPEKKVERPEEELVSVGGVLCLPNQPAWSPQGNARKRGTQEVEKAAEKRQEGGGGGGGEQKRPLIS